MNCARNCENLLNFVKVMPKILLVPFFSGHGVVASAAREARSVAELAATKKEDKYSGLAADYLFQPTAVEILASDFLSLLAKKISQHSGDERETAFLFQRVSALVQRYNSVLLHDSFVRKDYSE